METRALFIVIAASLAWTADACAVHGTLNAHGMSASVRQLAMFSPPHDDWPAEEQGMRPVAAPAADLEAFASRLQQPSPASRPLPFVNTGGASLIVDGLPAAAGGVSGAAGAVHYVHAAGGRMAIYRKHDGALLSGPFSVKAMFADAAFNSPMNACRSQPAPDAAIYHDQISRRWIVSYRAGGGASGSSGSSADAESPYYQCIAISTSADAAGSYYRYALQMQGPAGQALYFDDPKMAVWPDAYYFSFSLFASATGRYRGPRLCGIDRLALTKGVDAPVRCIDAGPRFGPMAPASFEGAAAGLAARRPALFVALAAGNATAAGRLYLWRFSARARQPARAIALAVAPYAHACLHQESGSCVKQPAPGTVLPAIGDRAAGAAYRQIGRRGVLVAHHTIQLADGRTGIRWYVIGDPLGRPHLRGQGLIGGGAENRWMGSTGIDKEGNIAIGYSVGAADTPPGIRYTGRAPHDPPDMMQSEEVIANGSGSALGQATARFTGSMALDPADGCTFWYTQRYVALTGVASWRTRIARLRFRSCR